MTEKEKMLKQMMYDANYDKELLQQRNQAKDLCYEYNQFRPSDEQGQKAVMRKLLGKTKENFAIMQPFWCDYGYNIEIGENFFANHNLVILDPAKVTFGDNVFIARTVDSTPQAIQSMRSAATGDWSTLTRLPLEIMSGLEAASTLCQVLPLETMW